MNRTPLCVRKVFNYQLNLFSVFKRRETTSVVKTRDPFCSAATDILDLRSKERYHCDHIPGAVNIPVDDNLVKKIKQCERSSKNYPPVEDPLLKTIRSTLKQYVIKKDSPETMYCPLVYCEMGHLKSSIVANILVTMGVAQVYLLRGGYNTFRKMVIHDLKELPLKFTFKVLSGYTGTGKTYLLNKMEDAGHQVLDLERLAKHKGSMLGLWYGETQPSKERWQCLLREALLVLDSSRPVWVESESQRIGQLSVPQILFEQFCKGDRFKIVLPLEERIKCSIRDYPYWMEDVDTLTSIIRKLEKFHGEEKVNGWISLVRSEKWEELVQHLLVDHYDPTYANSQRKNRWTENEMDVFMENQSEDVVRYTIGFITGDPVTVDTETNLVENVTNIL